MIFLSWIGITSFAVHLSLRFALKEVRFPCNIFIGTATEPKKSSFCSTQQSYKNLQIHVLKRFHYINICKPSPTHFALSATRPHSYRPYCFPLHKEDLRNLYLLALVASLLSQKTWLLQFYSKLFYHFFYNFEILQKDHLLFRLLDCELNQFLLWHFVLFLKRRFFEV